MKIAARFPVKFSTGLLCYLLGFHLLLALVVAAVSEFTWGYFVFLSALLVSALYCYKRCLSMCRADDDLCWSGENWLMRSNNRFKSIVYLQLQPTSWVSRHACLLHFKTIDAEFQWFFSRRLLGESLYSQLIYLVKLQLCSADNLSSTGSNTV